MPDFLIHIRAEAQQFGQVIQNTVTKLNNQLTGEIRRKFAGVFGGGALAFEAKAAIDYASQFNDSARKLGVGVEFLQEAAYAAKQTGASFGAVEDALKRLQIAQVAALGKPGSSQADAFGRLGVTLADLKSKGVEQIFSQIAANIQRANPSAQQLADTVLILGRSADDLLPAFRDGFSDLQKRARELGLVLDKETIEKLDSVGDRFDELKLRFRVFMADALGLIQKFVDGWRLVATYIAGFSQAMGTLTAGGSFADAQAAWDAQKDKFVAGIKARTAGAEGKNAPGRGVDPEAAKLLREQNLKTLQAQAELAFALLKPEQQLNELYARRALLLRYIAGTTDDLKRSQLKEELAGVDVQIAKFRAPTPGGGAGITSFTQDQFARQGLYLTGGATGLAQTQVGLLRVANAKLDQIKGAIDNTSALIKDVA